VADYNVWLTEICLRPSRILLAALAAAHLGALAVVLAMPLEAWLKSGLVLVAAASMGHALLHFGMLHGPNAVVALKLSGAGLEAETRAGAWFPATVLGSSFVSPWLTVLHLKLEGRRFVLPVVLLPDSLAADDFRRLRVWLRWGAAFRHGADDAAML
jgi:toxin CptA